MNKILVEDRKMCELLIENPTSENEGIFFKEILKKETEEISVSGDLLMSESDNDIGIYILRENYDEYRVGVAKAGTEFPEIHLDGIGELLSLNLMQIGVPDNISIMEWLRMIDYKGINYKANADIY